MTPPLHLDYATRDYDGFRQLLISVIDRQDTAWSERAAADLGIMVVDLLAYELDRLAYAGDRVAEEGFLGTARRRESARRHAALGDYALDRGNATRGLQWFELAAGQVLALPARSQVAAPLDPRHPDETRVIAETLDAASLDARRNRFVLAQSAPAGSTMLRLALPDGSTPDLRGLGLAPGMPLLVGMPVWATAPGPDEPPLQLSPGEAVRITAVLPHGVELALALHQTWPGGDDGAWVLGNVVEVRRGSSSPWTLIGRGGAALGDVASEQYLQLRMDAVRRLRAEVEDARTAWIDRAPLVAQWTSACQAVTALRRELLRTNVAAYDPRDPVQRALLDALVLPLATAAAAFRHVLTAVGHDVPDELAASDRVAVPRQELALPRLEQPVLWMDADPERPGRSETLAVAVGIAGAWSRWDERPDLLRSAPDDHHYVVELDGNSQVTLRFGDGVTGAMLPAGCQVMARWVSGDESGDDLRPGALGASLAAAQPSPIASTSDPLGTAGGRPPERLDGIAARVELGLEVPAIPVTAADYTLLLGRRDGIAESAVAIAHGEVDVVIRPAPGVAAGPLLAATRAWLERDRLAGTTVMVRLPRPLAIDIGVVVDVHPDVSAADLRYRVQRQLVDVFGDAADNTLGRRRELAEIYRVVEEVPGVLWSQVVAFDVAGRSPPGVAEAITPAADQVVRCAGLDDQPASGQVAIWAARRFSLQLGVRYATLDTRPDLAAIPPLIPALLSGPAALPVQRGWTAITAPLIDDALAVLFAGAGFTVKVKRLIVERRAVDAIQLGERELPILDNASVADDGLVEAP